MALTPRVITLPEFLDFWTGLESLVWGLGHLSGTQRGQRPFSGQSTREVMAQWSPWHLGRIGITRLKQALKPFVHFEPHVESCLYPAGVLGAFSVICHVGTPSYESTICLSNP